MKRLSNTFVNRLLVLAFLAAPVIYLFGVLLAGLVGSHGTFDIGNTDLFTMFFPEDNWLAVIGKHIVDNGANSYGFAPFASLFQYIDTNMLHFGTNEVAWALTLYGYLYYACHVLLLDVVMYVATFIFRIFKRIVDTLEGDMR